MGFPRQNYYSGYHFLLEGISPSHRLNPHLLLGRQIFFFFFKPLSHLGSPSDVNSCWYFGAEEYSKCPCLSTSSFFAWILDVFSTLWKICASREALYSLLLYRHDSLPHILKKILCISLGFLYSLSSLKRWLVWVNHCDASLPWIQKKMGFQNFWNSGSPVLSCIQIT